ncbi:FkbM family methyltransferase [Mongoliitalea daihaiensis]|nr:FkbM family methyltransferase [Mongoliitalea daihaiensis]
MILRKLFFYQSTGFYVDVGAYHPKKSSNTYHFYKKGWSGINIDAMPGSMKLFQQQRKRDINLEIPIGEDGEQLNFYIFKDQALNGFENERLKSKDQSKPQNKLIQVIPMKTASLTSILNQFLPVGQEIDFLDIDVEGGEAAVLHGLDFNKYRPKVILLELLDTELQDLNNQPLAQYLFEKGYNIKAKTVNTFIFESIQNARKK